MKSKWNIFVLSLQLPVNLYFFQVSYVKNNLHYTLAVTPPLPILPPSSPILPQISVCVDLAIWDTSYEWNPKICGLLWLSSYNIWKKMCIMFLRFIHIVPYTNSSFPFISNYSVIEAHHFFFIHQLIEVWVLWIMLLWTFMYKSLSGLFSILLGKYLGVGLLDHMVSLCLTFWGTVKCFSKCLNHFTSPLVM